MTQLFTEEGESVPVTVIEAGPCTVTAIRDAERDGYTAIQLAFGDDRRAQADQGRARPPQEGRRAADQATWSSSATSRASVEIGDEVTVADFEEGQRVKVSGDRDRQGLPGHDQAPQLQPRPGLATARTTSAPRARSAPAPIPPASSRACEMPGQMGGKRITQRGLEIVRDRRRRATCCWSAARSPARRTGPWRCVPMAEPKAPTLGRAGEERPARGRLRRALQRVARPRGGARRHERAPPRHRTRA